MMCKTMRVDVVYRSVYVEGDVLIWTLGLWSVPQCFSNTRGGI